MTAAERQRKRRANRKPGYCITCTKRKAVKSKTKCKKCAREALEAVYASRGQEAPPPKK